MTMTLHWSPRSPFVRKVMIGAHEKGLADQISCIPTAVPTDDRDHPIFRDNPLGRIPTLVLRDGGTVHGSSVICEYFDSLVEDPPLFPRDRQARLETRKREALGDGLMETLYGWMVERLHPSDRSAAVIARQSHKLRRTLAVLDQQAEGLSAVPFDVGAIAIASALSYLEFRLSSESWRDEHPALAQWFDAATERDSMRKTVLRDT